jgi:hypothetical protein
MSKCRGCGAEALRTSARYMGKDLLGEVCPTCDPDRFAGVKVTDPTDRKIWAGTDAEPDKYYDADDQGVKRAKDELRQDTWDAMNIDLDESARDQKRKLRRTEPMTQGEIAAAEHYGRNVLRPFIDEGKRAS